IARGTPDLILVSALLSPRDEDRLMAHLRSLQDAAHLQTLTIPRFAAGGPKAAERTSLGRFRKKAAVPVRAGCDPEVFAQEISAQLARAADIRKNPPVPSSARLSLTTFRDAQSDVGGLHADRAQADPVPAPDFSSLLFEADDSGPSSIHPDPVDPDPVEFEPAPEPIALAEQPEDHLARLARRFGFGAETLTVANNAEPEAACQS